MLVAALRDPEPMVRRQAVIALGKIKDKSAVLPMIDMLDPDDSAARTHPGHLAGAALDRLAQARARSDRQACGGGEVVSLAEERADVCPRHDLTGLPVWASSPP